MNKRKIKGDACGNRTHDFLGRFKEENKRKIKKGYGSMIAQPHSQLEIDNGKIEKKRAVGVRSHNPSAKKEKFKGNKLKENEGIGARSYVHKPCRPK